MADWSEILDFVCAAKLSTTVVEELLVAACRYEVNGYDERGLRGSFVSGDDVCEGVG
jgi:hypothetical protein